MEKSFMINGRGRYGARVIVGTKPATTELDGGTTYTFFGVSLMTDWFSKDKILMIDFWPFQIWLIYTAPRPT